jgi:hypothetical protein
MERFFIYLLRNQINNYMEFLRENWQWIAAIIGAILGTGLVIKFVSKKRTNKVVQKNNKVGGDQSGGDMYKANK